MIAGAVTLKRETGYRLDRRKLGLNESKTNKQTNKQTADTQNKTSGRKELVVPEHWLLWRPCANSRVPNGCSQRIETCLLHCSYPMVNRNRLTGDGCFRKLLHSLRSNPSALCAGHHPLPSLLVHADQTGCQSGLTLSLLRVINVKFLLQPHQKYYITQQGELGFS